MVDTKTVRRKRCLIAAGKLAILIAKEDSLESKAITAILNARKVILECEGAI